MPFGVARTNFRSDAIIGAPGPDHRLLLPFVNASVLAGGSVSANRRVLLNQLLWGLDEDGLIALLNNLWLYAAENSQTSLIDIISRATSTVVNSPTFTADRGYTGNGTSSYVNSGQSNCGTQNSATFAMYNRTNQTPQSGSVHGSIGGGSNACNIAFNWSPSANFFSMTDGDGDAGRTAPSPNSGIYVVTRTGSAGTACICYKDGTSIGNNGQVSVGVPTQTFRVGANVTAAGAAQNFNTDQMAMLALGNSGWTATQAANFTTRVQTYMTAIGA